MADVVQVSDSDADGEQELLVGRVIPRAESPGNHLLEEANSEERCLATELPKQGSMEPLLSSTSMLEYELKVESSCASPVTPVRPQPSAPPVASPPAADDAKELLVRELRADLRVRGLANNVGELRCFLNSAVQLLLWMPPLASAIAAAPGPLAQELAALREKLDAAGPFDFDATVHNTKGLQSLLDAEAARFRAGEMQDVAEAVDALVRAMIEAQEEHTAKAAEAQDAGADNGDEASVASTAEQAHQGTVAGAPPLTVKQTAGFDFQATWECRNPDCSRRPELSIHRFSADTLRVPLHEAIVYATSSDAPNPSAAFGPGAKLTGRQEWDPKTCDSCNTVSPVEVTTTALPSHCAFINLAWHSAPRQLDVTTLLQLVLQDEFDLTALVDAPASIGVRRGKIEAVALFRGQHYVAVVRQADGAESAQGWWLVDDFRVARVARDWHELCSFIYNNKWAPMLLGVSVSAAEPQPSARWVPIGKKPSPMLRLASLVPRKVVARRPKTQREHLLDSIVDVAGVSADDAVLALDATTGGKGVPEIRLQRALSWILDGKLADFKASRSSRDSQQVTAPPRSEALIQQTLDTFCAPSYAVKPAPREPTLTRSFQPTHYIPSMALPTSAAPPPPKHPPPRAAGGGGTAADSSPTNSTVIVDNTRRGAPIFHGVTFMVLGSNNGFKKGMVETIKRLGGTVLPGNAGMSDAAIIVSTLEVLLDILRDTTGKKEDAKKILRRKAQHIVNPKFVTECASRSDTSTKGRPDHTEYAHINDSRDAAAAMRDVALKHDKTGAMTRLGLSFNRAVIPNHLQ